MELNKDTIKHLIWIVFAGVAFNWGLQHLEAISIALSWIVGLLTPFLLGGAIAFILNVPMQRIEPRLFPKAKRLRRLRRPLAVVLTILLVLAILAFAAFVIVPGVTGTAKQAAAQVPHALKAMEHWILELEKRLPEVGEYLSALEIDWDSLVKKAADLLTGWGGSLLNSGVSIVSGVVSGVTTFFIGLFFAIYVLMQKEKLARQCKELLYAVLPERAADRTVGVARLAERTFSSFLSGQCIEAVILGSLFAVSMTILRLPYAPLIGVLIALTALIPIVGAFIGCVVGALLILMVSPIQALEFVILFLVLQQIEGNLIYPHVVGSSVGLPSIWVLAAVTLGGKLMGILGMLVFIPLCSVCYALLREFTHHRLSRRGISPSKWGGAPPSPKETPKETEPPKT